MLQLLFVVDSWANVEVDHFQFLPSAILHVNSIQSGANAVVLQDDINPHGLDDITPCIRRFQEPAS